MGDMLRRPLNEVVLRVFAPLLLVVGVLGFVTPEALALTSGAAPYNLFHLAFGAIGLACVWKADLRFIRGFTIGFGLIDLYQAVASVAGLWPKAAFEWKLADDMLHLVVGLGLLGVGLLADRPTAPAVER